MLLAVFFPAPGAILAIAATIAAAAVGGLLPGATGKLPELTATLSVAVGVIGALVVAFIMGIASALTFGTTTVVCLIVAFALALITSAITGKRKSAEVPATA